MSEGEKNVKVALECIEGAINLFYVFINGKKVIAGSGTKRQQWSGKVPEGEIRLKVRVTGIDDARYTINIDMPGTVNDQQLTFSLEGGYHEFEMRF